MVLCTSVHTTIVDFGSRETEKVTLLPNVPFDFFGLQGLPEARRKAVQFNDFKLTLTSDEPDESWVSLHLVGGGGRVRGHAPPENFVKNGHFLRFKGDIHAESNKKLRDWRKITS